MKIFFEDNHIIVVQKPVNVLSQADETLSLDMVTMIKDYLKVTYHKPGEAYLGLIHRLDRPVGGVMVFAKTSKAASRLSEQVQTHQFEKKYLAIARGQPEPGLYRDYLYKDRKSNTSRTVNKEHKEAKLAELTIESVSPSADHAYSRVLISLKSGRSHQIRVQLASRGHPLWGDQRYNPESLKGQQIALWAYELSFYHPITKEKLTFHSEPDSRYPFV